MAVNQVAIDRLRLDEAFTEKMLHRAFNECWTVKCDETLFVVDDEETRIYRFGSDSDDMEKALLVFNENKREIVLLSVDNQLLKGVEGGLADCALFDDHQFRFVEFKTNAEGKNEKAIRKTLDKASHQLKNTIRIFNDSLKSVDIVYEDAITLSCHIVLSKSFPSSPSVMQDFQIEFMLETGGTMLEFSSETHWEEPE